MQAIPDQSVDLIVCDLPYGTTANKWDSRIPLDALWVQYNRVIKPNRAIVLFTQQPFTTTVAASNLRNLKSEWIWSKQQGTGFLNAKKYPLKSHENILVFSNGLPLYHPQMKTGYKPYTCKRGAISTPNYSVQKQETITVSDGTRYPLTVLSYKYDRPKLHPTQKPVSLLEYLIRTYSNEGDLVLDNCAGSGSTLVAAVNTGRHYVGYELDPTYHRIATDRLADTTR